MTQAEWIAHWEDRQIGMSLRGLVLDTDERLKGPLSAGQYAMTLPEKVRTLLQQMYQTAQPEPPKPPSPPPSAVNGTTPTAQGAKNGEGKATGNGRGTSTSEPTAGRGASPPPARS